MEDGYSNIDIPYSAVEIPEAALAEAEAALAEEQRALEIDKDLETAFEDISGDEEYLSDESDEESSLNKSNESELSQSSIGASVFNPNTNQRNEQSIVQNHYEHKNESLDNEQFDSVQHSCESSSNDFSHSCHTPGPSDVYNASSLTEGDDQNTNYLPPMRFQENSYINTNSHDGYAANGPPNPVKATEDSTAALQEQYRTLHILYQSTRQELQILKNAEQNYRQDSDQEKLIFESKLGLLEDEKERLSSSLQDAQILISDYKNESTNLRSQVNSLELQLLDMTDTKNDALSKLEGYEVTIHSLEKQLRELKRSENGSRLRVQHDRILEEIKIRHQKEILCHKENIDELQRSLNAKVQDVTNLIDKKSQLQEKCEHLQFEKTELFNKLSDELEAAQKRVQQCLKSGAVEEVGLLKLQVQHFEEENSNMNKQNAALKDEIKSLKAELSTSEALQKLAFSHKKQTLQDPSIGRQKELNLQSELENSLKNVRSLRSENHGLKKQWKEVENQIPQLTEKARLYESYYTEAKKKSEELEEMLKSHTSNESSAISLHEKKIKVLEDELNVLKIKLRDAAENLREASRNEKMLNETNSELQRKMTEIIQKDAEEKRKALEECREKYLEIHENAIKKLKENLTSKSEVELKDMCTKYENKIDELQREIKTLNDQLYDSKAQYLTIYKDNQNLQTKLDEIYKPKEREEIEKDIRREYEHYVKQMKEQLIKQYEDRLAERLKTEIENAQIEWTNKKMAEIKVFVDTTKQNLHEEFQNCIQKEHSVFQQQLETEKNKFHQEYEEKVKDLKRRYEEEKDRLNAHPSQNTQSQWENKLIDHLKESHEKEIENLKHRFENKILTVEKELKSQKDNVYLKSQEQEEINKLKQHLMEHKQLFEKEKSNFLMTESVLNENYKTLAKTEKKLREKVKKYQRHVTSLEKRHKEKLTEMQGHITELQKSRNEMEDQLLLSKERYEQEILNLGNKFNKFHNLCRNSETQTEEEVVSKQNILNMENKFFKCLKNISDGTKHYLIELKNRNAEKIQTALLHYHQQMTSEMFQDLSKDIHSFTPTFIVPRTTVKSAPGVHSKETFDSLTNTQDFQNGKFKTSTPGIFGSTTKHYAGAEKTTSNKNGSTSTDRSNFSPETNVKSMFGSSSRRPVTSSETQNFLNTMYKTSTPPTVDALSSGDVYLPKKDISGINGLTKNLNDLKDPESTVGFEDISYDFLSLNIPGGLFDSNKMPGYCLHENQQGIKTSNFFKDSFPVRLNSKE